MTARGRFIVLEGLDGSGTTTQVKLLADSLTRAGRQVHCTAEPSTGPLGGLLRQVLKGRLLGRDGDRMAPQAVAALYAADRADHLAEEIEPMLAAGFDVICDRYVHSSLAYQGAECPVAWVAAMNQPFPSPDLVLLVRVSVEVAAARRMARGERSELFDADEFQRRVAAGYEASLALRPNDPVALIDGTESVEAVHRAILRAVTERLG